MTIRRHTGLNPLEQRRPLRVLFVITSMPVGGAETLLVNLIRRMDRAQFAPELCCLKQLGPLGEVVADEIPTHHGLLSGKLDLRVLPRLARLMHRRRIDAVVTVGAGDKMFWGRLAARWARVPVVLSAIHSTGWPDTIGRLNRLLTSWTDGFIACAEQHGRHLAEQERFPAEQVFVIPNGVDVERFAPQPAARRSLREQLAIPEDAPVCGIVAALRPEKNHALFLQMARRVLQTVPAARFLIVGDGPQRAAIAEIIEQLGLGDAVSMLGTRSDVPELLATFDVFALTSHNEANPVSILEAMATGVPVVATRVGSIAESLADGVTGWLVPPGDAEQLATRVGGLLADPSQARSMGAAGRAAVVQHWSLETMVGGYQRLIETVYRGKQLPRSAPGASESQIGCDRSRARAY